MSSYSCVIPVNWSLLWVEVIPAWLAVLAGSVDASAFYARYVPAGDVYGDLLSESYAAPRDYLSLFTTPLHPPYFDVELRFTGKCAEFHRVADSTASPHLLEAAIKQTAGVNMSGLDPYAGLHYASTNDAYGAIQVAGTKNRYPFLEGAFEVMWQQQMHHYTYSRRQQGATSRLQGLLESLFLYLRVIPGTWFPSSPNTWPGYDDLSFAGYLSPSEVKVLLEELVLWEVPHLETDLTFLLFVDRVRRASESGLGLLTIHAGL
jgi:hypothetical protein